MRSLTAPVLWLAVLAAGSALPAAARDYDIIIAGAGSGGVSAAIQAARMGARVALLEETDWIGGQMTAAAVSTMDEARRNSDSGIYKEFTARIARYYAARGKSIATCYWSDRTVCFEPRVGRRILAELIREAGRIELRLRTRVARVLYSGGRITGVVTAQGAVLKCKALIDATEYGDVLPLAPVRYRAGNSTSDALDPSACIQDLTYTAIVKRYPGGVPKELLLEVAPPSYDQAARKRFAEVVTKDGHSRWTGAYPVNWAVHNAYRGLPDSSQPGSYTGLEGEKITRTGVNWANDFPATAAVLDRRQRKKIICEAKLRTLQFLYYMQHELGETGWSVADDEGFDTGYNREENSCEDIPARFKAIERNLPPLPYVRESNRIIGSFTLTAADIRREGNPPRARKNFPTALAVGDYSVDLHGCNAESTLEPGERLSDRPRGWVTGVFQVPFEAFIPEGIDGLLAAEKNLSQTRLANGATRLQPITMLTGQAAGAIAALAVRSGVPPRRVNPIAVQRVLLEAKSTLALRSFLDVPKNHPRWAAVQLATVHEWMAPAAEDRFGIDQPLTSADLEAASRFGLTPPRTRAELAQLLAGSAQ